MALEVDRRSASPGGSGSGRIGDSPDSQYLASQGDTMGLGDDEHIYDGVDDILQVEIQDEYMNLLPVVSSTVEEDLYDDGIMGSTTDSEGRGSNNNSQSDSSSLPEELDTKSVNTLELERKDPSAFSENNPEKVSHQYSPNSGYARNRYDESSSRTDSRARRHAVYVGNLSWWTKDEDIRKAFDIIGIKDIVDVKIYECKLNGQSKGFCSVTFSSEASISIAFEKLSQIKIDNNVPSVKADTKQSLSYLDSQSKTRPSPSSSLSQSGNIGISGRGIGYGGPGQSGMLSRNGPTMGSPIILASGIRNQYPRNNGYRTGPMPRHNNGAYMGGGKAFHNESNGYPHMTHGNHMMRFPRGPPPSIMNNSYSCYDDWYPRPQPQYAMVRPGIPPPDPHMNPAFLGPTFLPPPSIHSGISSADSGNRSLSLVDSTILFSEPPPQINSQATSLDSTAQPSKDCSVELYSTSSSNLTEEEILDMLNRNNSVSTAAIKRAVTDATNGEYASAIETLVIAISLIRSSTISNEKRCLVIIDSLHDTLQGIENRSYGFGHCSSRRKGRSDDKDRRSHRHNRGSRSPDQRRSRSRESRDHGSYYRSDDRDSYRVRREPSSRSRLSTTGDRERGRPRGVMRDPVGRPHDDYKVRLDRFEADI